MRADRDRLADMLEAIERIQRHAGAGREVFDTDELIQVWVVRHLQIIGEAASRLSEDLRARYPDVPRRRNVIVAGGEAGAALRVKIVYDARQGQ